MKSLIRTVLFVLGLPLIGGAAGGTETSPQSLVRQLGDRDFHQRVSAERQLLQLGSASLAAVGRGTESDDPEVRRRAHRLLDLLQRLMFEEHEEEIRSNPWTVPVEIVPAWDIYHSLVGDGFAARELYVELLKHEMTLMLSVQRSPEEWPVEFERRCADIQTFFTRRSDREVHPVSAAALLFLASHPDNQPSKSAVSTVNLLISDARFSQAVEHSSEGPVLRSLLSHWITSDRNSTPQMRLSQAARFNLPAGMHAARQLIDSRDATGQSRTQLQNAILFLAKHGGLSVVDELERLLADKTSLWPARSRSSNEKDLQVRDVALLGLLCVTDQDPESYGFVGLRNDANYLYSANSGSFPDNEQRRAALTRWQEWRRQHLRGDALEVEDASEGFSL